MSTAAAIAQGRPINKRERTLITPEGIAVPMVVASRGARAGALILDILILIFALILATWILGWIAGGIFDSGVVVDESQTSNAREFLSIIAILTGFIAWYGYFLAQELGPRGATLGKRAVGIRVAAHGGARLTPEAVIARNLLRDIEIFYPLIFMLVLAVMSSTQESLGGTIWAATIWFFIFLLFPFFNKDALRAGDIIAGTWVVEAPKTKLAETLSTQGAASGTSHVTGVRYDFGDEELSIYGERELQTLERMLREAEPDALSAVHETICRKIGWDPGAGDERAFLEAFYAQLRAKLEGDMRFGKRKADKFS
ncbi:MAG: RDD family protein [Pseudomonadota bacterium]